MDKITIGKILSPHGIKGEVKVMPLTDYPERYHRTRRVWSHALEQYLDIEGVRPQIDLFLIKFQHIEDRSAAEKLTNSLLSIAPEDMIALPPGKFYQFQIIGLEVLDGSGLVLGQIREVLRTGANDVYVVQREGRKDLLIPALKTVVREIDLQGKKMLVELPPGLDD